MALNLTHLPADMEIVSKRLRLVPIRMEYAESVFRNFTPEVTTYMFPASPAAIEETHAFIRDAIARRAAGTDLVVAILNGATGEFLGNAGLHDLDGEQPVLGIWLKKAARGNQYGVETIGALIDWARANADFAYLRYPVDRRNIPSRRIPEFFGGVFSSAYRQMNHSGRELDLVEYWIYPVTS